MNELSAIASTFKSYISKFISSSFSSFSWLECVLVLVVVVVVFYSVRNVLCYILFYSVLLLLLVVFIVVGVTTLPLLLVGNTCCKSSGQLDGLCVKLHLSHFTLSQTPAVWPLTWHVWHVTEGQCATKWPDWWHIRHSCPCGQLAASWPGSLHW